MMRQIHSLLKPRSSKSRERLHLQRRQGKRNRSLFFEHLETRHLLAADWQNPLFQLDVTDDAHVSPIDALVVINTLNEVGARELTEPFDNDSPLAVYWDVNGDGFVAPSDALAIINYFNQLPPALDLSLALANDAGESATDGVTNDPRVQGQVEPGGAGIATARVRVNRDDVVPLSLDAQGRFAIDPRLVSTFTEGAAKVGIFISDASGALALSGLRLTLDATPPPSPTVTGFSADSGVPGDGITTDDTLLISGVGEAGIRVNVLFNGSSQGTVTPSPDGVWSFGAASKDDGYYTISAVSEDTAGNASPASAPLLVHIATGFLRGAADDPANEHIPDVYFPDAYADDLSIDDRLDGTGLETSRTRLMVQFTDTATVGQVNGLLQSLGAGIQGAMPDIHLVLITIPDTGDLSGLDQALAILESHPAIVLAVQDVALGVTTLPGSTNAHDPAQPANSWLWNYPPSNGNGRDGNWGMEAVRAPQMWNLNTYGNRSVNTSVNPHPRTGILDAGFNDMNGDGTNDHPDSDVPGLRTWIRSGNEFQLGASAHDHGQHVAGIIGAGFHNSVGVDGINPFAERHAPADGHFIGVSLTSVSIPAGLPREERRSFMFAPIIADLRLMLDNWPLLDVVNISLGYNWGAARVANPNTNISAQLLVADQGRLVRQIAANHPNTVIVAAAGNDSSWGYANEIYARLASPFNWAGLAGTAGLRSPNILVVESMDDRVGNAGSPAYAWQYTKSDFSNVGGDVSAPGGSILSTVGNNIILDNDSDGLFDEDPRNPFDNDGDGLFDEDPVNNIDDDNDLSVDEDPYVAINDDGDQSANGVQIFDEDPVEGFSNYFTEGGTSMAAPHVTGLIGYLLTLDPNLFVEDIRTLITHPDYTRTTVLRNNNGFDDDGDGVADGSPDIDGDGIPDNPPEEQPLPSNVVGPAPMIDAFAAAMGIDLIRGNKDLQKALVDVDDGTRDGNLRVDPLEEEDVFDVLTSDHRRGDGHITMRDFRAWRDALPAGPFG